MNFCNECYQEFQDQNQYFNHFCFINYQLFESIFTQQIWQYHTKDNYFYLPRFKDQAILFILDIDSVKILKAAIDKFLSNQLSSFILNKQINYQLINRYSFEILHIKQHNQNSIIYGKYLDIEAHLKKQQSLINAKDQADFLNKQKDYFLASMSHEIRTPMNAILGMTDLLLKTKLDIEQYKWANIIKNSGEFLLKIINDILDFSKIKANKLQLEHIKFDFFNLIEEIIDLFSVKIKIKNIELITKYPNYKILLLYGDPTKIKQILINLISNALKFTEHGHVLIEITTTKLNNDKLKLLFVIKDTGIGISKKEAGLLFSEFVQAPSNTIKKYNGTGLGLAISKKLTQLMNGNIWLKSTLNKGTNFFFEIDLLIAEQQLSQSPLKNNLSRILLIDKYLPNIEQIKNYLQDHYLINNVDSDQLIRVLRKATQQKTAYSLLIIDYDIINQNPDIIRIIKQDPQIAKMKFIITAQASINDNDQRWLDYLNQLGIDAILSRPFHPWQLKNLIKLTTTNQFNQTQLLTKNSVIKDLNTDNKVNNTFKLPDFSQKSVLVVEDLAVNQLLMKSILKKTNCQIAIASDGIEALKLIKINNFDLIFMDSRMPKMNGFEATTQIRIDEQLTKKHVIIIALTADAMQGDKELCLSFGMDDYLYKPLKQDKLINMMMKYLV